MDHVDAVDGAEHDAAVGPGVGRRGTHHLGLHDQRLGRLVQAVEVPGPLGHADQARAPGVHRHHRGYRPCQVGGRFSLKARGPSLASSVAKIAAEISASIA